MKVRVGSKYTFDPCGWDMCDPQANHPEQGQVVVVVNLHGCPKANTMGHCYVNDLQGNFRGLVCTNSLTPAGKVCKHLDGVIKWDTVGKFWIHTATNESLCASGKTQAKPAKKG